MKSAKEWIDLVDNNKIDGNPQTEESTDCCIINNFEIKQIQLDAYKAGMSEAAEIVAGFPTTNSTTSQGERDLVMKQAILSARDKKETL